MAAGISLHEPVKSVQRDLVELLRAAIADLDDRRVPLATRVHELRKRLKRARAWAQILPKPLARRVDNALRDIHQRLGQRRDQDATLEAIARLLATARDAGRDTAVAGLLALREPLRRLRETPAADTLAADTLAADTLAADLGAVHTDLARLTQLVDQVALDGDFRLIADSAASIARRSRHAMRKAIRSGEAHDYHRWRKWMKYHWFHLRYLAPLWPDLLRVEADAAEHVAEALGQSQDIELVRAALDASALPPAQRQAVTLLVDREQQHLMRAAASIGLHIHAETPAAFEKRLNNYCRARLYRSSPA